MINFLLKKSKSSQLEIKCLPSIDISPKKKILSISKISSLSVSPAKLQLTISRQWSNDIPPNSQQNTEVQNQDLLSKVELIQSELIETEKGFERC